MSEHREWRSCVDFPTYDVSSDGLVRRNIIVRGRSPKILKTFMDRGYPALKLRVNGLTKKAYIHRLYAKAFLGLDDDAEVDHRTHRTDEIDDLRVATRAQNARNSRGHANSSSRFKGVSWDSRRRLWYACIAFNKKTKNLGTFSAEEDAAKAYDQAALAAWGEYAFLNFPREAA